MEISNQKKYRFNGVLIFLCVVVLFISGALCTYYGYFSILYYENFDLYTEDYTDSYLFESKYLQYNERTALYLRHMESGYRTTGRTPKYIDFASSISQTNFDYYYNKLFNENNTFFFYISDNITGTYYYNTSMTTQLTEYLKQYNIETEYDSENPARVSKKTLEKFINVLPDIYSVIEIDSISAANKDVFSSNVLISNNEHSYTNVVSNSPFIVHAYNNSDYYIMSYFSNNPQGYVCSYDIYTAYIENDFAEGEFGAIKLLYNNVAPIFNEGLFMIPISLVTFIISLVFLIMLCGHHREHAEIVLTAYDRIPLEISALSLILPAIHIGISLNISFSLNNAAKLFEYTTILKFLLLPYAIGFIFALPFILSVAKNLKAHTFTDHTISLRFIRYLCRKLFLKPYAHIKDMYLSFRISFVHKDMRKIILAKMFLMILFYVFTFIICASAADFDITILLVIGFLLFLSFIIFFGDMVYHCRDISILKDFTKKLASGELDVVFPDSNTTASFKIIMDNISSLSNVLSDAVEKESRSERMKAELITNVSHDIKTPLTSIINYVDLLRRSDIDDTTRNEYLKVIQEKSWRLKSLIDDLMEVSKASSKTIKLTPSQLNLTELIKQSLGEFEDKFTDTSLEVITDLGNKPVYIYADGRSTYRIIENLLSNACKYSIAGSRVYINLTCNERQAMVTIKNISQKRLTIKPEDLMERFVRGDSSRNTEGNGLGISIAKSLTEVQDGEFDIEFDGDLFKASFTLPLIIMADETENIPVTFSSDNSTIPAASPDTEFSHETENVNTNT